MKYTNVSTAWVQNKNKKNLYKCVSFFCEKMIHSILLPKGYYIFEKEQNSWVQVENIPEISECWNGNKFVKVQTNILSQSTDFISIILDSVTCIALLPNSNKNITVNFHCNLPIYSNYENKEDYDPRYFFAAINDFSKKIGVDNENILCKIPSSRLNNIINIYDQINIVARDKTSTTLCIPNECIEEESPDNFQNALAYIKTVISLKGLKHQNNDIEIRDDGISLQSSAFRRLRRMISICGSTSDVILRVNQISNGKRKKMKRQFRLRKNNFIERQINCQTCKRLPNHAIRKPRRYKVDKENVTNVTWYKVNIINSNSLGLEGLVVLFGK